MLSSRARKLLARGKREPIVVSGEKARALFRKFDIVPRERLVEFECRWGGWKYPVWGGRYAGRIGFFEEHEAGIYDGTIFEDRGMFLFQCAEQDYEQFFTLMDEDGRIFEWRGEGTQPQQTSDSIVSYIESQAMFETLFGFPQWLCMRIETEMPPQELAGELGLNPVVEATDSFKSWFAGSSITMQVQGNQRSGNDFCASVWLHAHSRSSATEVRQLSPVLGYRIKSERRYL